MTTCSHCIGFLAIWSLFGNLNGSSALGRQLDSEPWRLLEIRASDHGDCIDVVALFAQTSNVLVPQRKHFVKRRWMPLTLPSQFDIVIQNAQSKKASDSHLPLTYASNDGKDEWLGLFGLGCRHRKQCSLCACSRSLHPVTSMNCAWIRMARASNIMISDGHATTLLIMHLASTLSANGHNIVRLCKVELAT